jgi:hypothetical protein
MDAPEDRSRPGGMRGPDRRQSDRHLRPRGLADHSRDSGEGARCHWRPGGGAEGRIEVRTEIEGNGAFRNIHRHQAGIFGIAYQDAGTSCESSERRRQFLRLTGVEVISPPPRGWIRPDETAEVHASVCEGYSKTWRSAKSLGLRLGAVQARGFEVLADGKIDDLLTRIYDGYIAQGGKHDDGFGRCYG